MAAANTMRFTVLLLMLAFSATTRADQPPPAATVLRWLKLNEKVEVGEPKAIRLTSGETAFLFPANFDDRGRNFMRGVVLARPAIRSAREIEGIAGHSFEVATPEPRARSFVAINESGSGQGTVEGRMALYTFSGWTPTVILQTEYHSNLGYCGPPTPFECHSTTVSWRFEERELIETKVVESGLRPDRLARKRFVKRYSLHGGRFVAEAAHSRAR